MKVAGCSLGSGQPGSCWNGVGLQELRLQTCGHGIVIWDDSAPGAPRVAREACRIFSEKAALAPKSTKPSGT
jgi:hypothetical protein